LEEDSHDDAPTILCHIHAADSSGSERGLSPKMAAHHRIVVAKRSDIAPGSCRPVEAGGIWIALCRVGDEFYALDNACPHAGGPLGEGFLEGDLLTCPWHAWRYDVRTGRRPENPAIAVPVYSVTVEGEDVMVEIPAESA
jgi:nitrite reductase (NADH) small subunit/3-phenylpropionate/trans-cinnamate dioxygenase ferredoxin subunit